MSDTAQVDAESRPALALMSCCLLVLPAVLLVEAFAGRDVAQLVITWAIIIFGAVTFFSHGGRFVTASGVWTLSSALLFGFAAFLSRWTAPEWQEWVYWAQLWGYGTTVAMYALFLSGTSAAFKRVPRWAPSKQRRFIAEYGIRVGAAMSAVGALSSNIASGALGPMPDALLHTGVTMLAASAIMSAFAGPVVFDRRLFGMIVAGIGVLLFLEFGFTGTGRLNVVTLGMGVAISAGASLRGRWHKVAVLVLVLPLLVVFAQRSEKTELTLSQLQGRDGLGSVVSPIETFAELHYRDDHGSEIPRANGATFATALVTWVPRNVWPDKPIGFGAVLTQHLRPELLSANHSMAALAQGEWYFNFGVLGLVAMLPAFGLLVRWFDQRLVASLHRKIRNAGDLGRHLVWVVLAAGLADLIWVGSFTYVERAGTRAAMLIAVGLGLGWWRRPRRAHAALKTQRGARPSLTRA